MLIGSLPPLRTVTNNLFTGLIRLFPVTNPIGASPIIIEFLDGVAITGNYSNTPVTNDGVVQLESGEYCVQYLYGNPILLSEQPVVCDYFIEIIENNTFGNLYASSLSGTTYTHNLSECKSLLEQCQEQKVILEQSIRNTEIVIQNLQCEIQEHNTVCASKIYIAKKELELCFNSKLEALTCILKEEKAKLAEANSTILLLKEEKKVLIEAHALEIQQAQDTIDTLKDDLTSCIVDTALLEQQIILLQTELEAFLTPTQEDVIKDSITSILNTNNNTQNISNISYSQICSTLSTINNNINNILNNSVYKGLETNTTINNIKTVRDYGYDCNTSTIKPQSFSYSPITQQTEFKDSVTYHDNLINYKNKIKKIISEIKNTDTDAV